MEDTAVSLLVSGGVIVFSNKMEQAVVGGSGGRCWAKAGLVRTNCLLILVQCIVTAFFILFLKKDGPQLS